MSNPRPKHILVIDLETTGLDPELDDIIEVGAILADIKTLDEIDRFTTVITPSNSAWQRLNADKYIRQMHEANGLYDVLRDRMLFPSKYGLPELENELVEWHASHGVEGPDSIVFGGSGIATFDIPRIKAQLPKLASMAVGVLRRAYAMWSGKGPLVTVDRDKTHRALQDAECHLAELRAFRGLFGHIGAGGEL